ncbi:hypothetical protein AAJ72_09990 [Citromicrobium sp. RCC1885]|uniref:hypothetical protein n=1 Tax=unclassified Citromicrobium TaxID=2630544 RepID=UPI0006C93B64|nr:MULTISPECIES: hypothetical protein [unclassified Citromicrobium]KPM23226.1 hypothetical protein AAJ72_09990 [Citromicrobium sp. RCC1885]KPM26633.1 hypothetical protein AAJ74_10730 [Citromicrobium sp. RCC1878]OAM08850.1 hypothetical protein A0U43_09575 [Citromicrobium sp. RCC1897]|tara:strand:+ start:4491 stop:4946 length:456 start_codon:yes stop_codon:yes gene_type:complete
MTTDTETEQTRLAQFDPEEWLTRFEECGGWFMIDTDGKPQIFLQAFANENYDEAAEMQRRVSPEQLKAVLDARLAQAELFDPAPWVVEFKKLGGTVHADRGQVITGWVEEDRAQADRAARHRNRLIPSEVAKLRSYLYGAFGLPLPTEKAA